ENRLARRAAHGRPKAPGDIVETYFRALMTYAVFVWTSASVDRADGTAPGPHRVLHFASIERRHQLKKVTRLRGGMPRYAAGLVFDKVGERRVPRRRLREIPPDPFSFGLRGYSLIRVKKHVGVPDFLWRQANQGFWNRVISTSRNKKHARARLW